MQIINGDAVSKMCSYSFGDQAGVLMGIPGAFMKKAKAWGFNQTPVLDENNNAEFVSFCIAKHLSKSTKPITLFIDNIRLYKRPIKHNDVDKVWIDKLQEEDLLALCATLPNKFIIYTSHEDTPIDEHIYLPPNVLKIYATNAVYNNDKIIPFPYGLQRKMNDEDNRIEIMTEMVEKDEHQEPTKLLYINCGLGSERNAPERAYLPQFEAYEWATCRFNKDSMFFPYSEYRAFLSEMRDHKFMICPEGHGIDCHRNWELLYMRRVPVMKESPYFRRLMAGFPVLFVNDWSEITEELLIENDHLYEQAQAMDLSKLDLKNWLSTG